MAANKNSVSLKLKGVRASGTSAANGFRPFIPAILFSIFSIAITVSSTFKAPETGQIAVMFSPGSTNIRVLSKIISADGLIVGPTRFGNIFVAYAQDKNFAERIKKLGAVAVFSATGLCAPLTEA